MKEQASINKNEMYQRSKEMDFIFLDPSFDKCLIGFDTDLRPIYSFDSLLEELVGRLRDYNEAMDYIYFNIVGAYLGDKAYKVMYMVEDS